MGLLLVAVAMIAIAAGFILVDSDVQAQANPEMARMMRAVGLPTFSVSLVTFMSLFVWLRRHGAEEAGDDMS